MRFDWKAVVLALVAGTISASAQAGSASTNLATKYPANASASLTTTYPAALHTASAALATQYPTSGGSSTAGKIINPSLASNPSGWTILSITGQGRTFSYNSSDCSSTQLNHAEDNAGDCPVYENGAPTGYYAWQLGLGSDGNVYGYNLDNTQWSEWNGTAFVLTGSGPDGQSTSSPLPLLGNLTPTAYGGPAVPFQFDVFPGDGHDIPYTSAFGSPPPGGWISRVPDLQGRNPSGPTNYYAINTVFPNDPTTASYDMNICAGGSQCTGSSQPDWAGLAAGTYDAEINSQLQQFLVPLGKNLVRVDIDHEKYGSCWFVWQMFGCNSSGIPAATYIAGEQHMIALLRQSMPWIKIGCESPGQIGPTGVPFYPGNSYCDVIVGDDYRQNYGTGDTDYQDWQPTQSGLYGTPYGVGSSIEFAAQNGMEYLEPEYGDGSAPYNCTPPLNSSGGCPADTGNMESYFIELYASIALSLGETSGGNWDAANGVGDDMIGDTYNNTTGSNVTNGSISPKQVALARPWPDGLYGTMYAPPPGAPIPLPSALQPTTVPFMSQGNSGFWSMLDELLWPEAQAASQQLFTPIAPDAAARNLRQVEMQLANPNLSAAQKTNLQALATQLQSTLTAAQQAWKTAHPVPSNFLH